MPKTALEQWDETAANNTDIGGLVLSNATQIDALDDIEREHMSQIAKWLGDDTVASASTADLGAVPGRYVNITGTTTITAFGTIKAGTVKYVKFAAALTLTHNATSLILPGGANITTAAGDTATFVSEGSGNWRCLSYQVASISPPVITPWVAYTPTIAALGTVASVNIASRRVGGSLEVKGRFNAGTPTASTVTMTLGFGGTNGNVTIASLFTDRVIVGHGALSYVAAVSPTVLGVGGEGYVTFGFQSSTQFGLSPLAGTSLLGAGDTLSIEMSVPIQGWK